jgi:ABC-type sulfate/molybdate transport systems ATPase subunit
VNSLSISITVPRRDFEVRADLLVAPGERLALFGPSGAGKTTVLETITGLVPPRRGAVRLGAELLSRPPARRRRLSPSGPTPAAVEHVSAVRQPPAVFLHMSVEANVAYGRSDPELVEQVVAHLDLEQVRRHRPGSLSGGQIQRVALARALARRFAVLLLDEPFSGLDAPTRRRCREVVERRAEEEQAATVMVTHDLREAQAFGHRLAVIDAGSLLAVGDPHELVSQPGTRRVAELVGYVSFLRVRDPAGSRLTLAVDQERFRIAGGHAECPPDRASSWSKGGPGAAVHLRLSGRVVSCVAAGGRFEARLFVPAGATLSTSDGATFVTEDDSEVPAVVASPVPVGKERLAAATMPPTVAG